MRVRREGMAAIDNLLNRRNSQLFASIWPSRRTIVHHQLALASGLIAPPSPSLKFLPKLLLSYYTDFSPPRYLFNCTRMEAELEGKAFVDAVQQVTASLSSARESLRTLRSKDLDTSAGISLLTIKQHLLMSYLRSLALLCANKALGRSITALPPVKTLTFNDANRSSRGTNPGALIDSLIENRIVLEKVRALEARMRYQIEKLVKLASEDDGSSSNVLNDPLAFRPNPESLMGTSILDGPSAENIDEDNEALNFDPRDRGDGIYRPPKLAPTPYPTTSKKNNGSSGPAPNALASLAYTDASKPYAESASGLGGNASGINGSHRAREIARMTEFEEENFTRLVMNKKEAKRRARDEANIALGGVGLTGGRRRGDGLAEEFRDVLRSGEGKSKAITGVDDGYEQLRQRGKKRAVLERARVGGHNWDTLALDEGSKRKKTRLDRDANALKRQMKRKARR